MLRGGAIASAVATPAEDTRIGENFAVAQRMQADLFRRGSEPASCGRATPAVLARMFSGLVSAFQAAELATEPPGEPGEPRELLPLEDLLSVIEAAFAAAEKPRS